MQWSDDRLAIRGVPIAGETPVSMEITVKGDISGHDSSVLAISALKGALVASGCEDVTYVNAPGLAAERGVTSTSQRHLIALNTAA